MSMKEENPQKAVVDHFYEEMKKPENTERLSDFLDKTTLEYKSILEDTSVSAEHQIVKFMNKYGYMAIPFIDPLKGEFGVSIHNAYESRYSQYDEDNKHVPPSGGPLHIYHKIYHDAVERPYSELKHFVNMFNDAHDKNYLIVRHDDPRKLRVGFIVLKNDGVVYHSIRLSDINPIWKPKTEKEKLHDNALAMPKPQNQAEEDVDNGIGKCITYGSNSQHETGWAGLLEFNVPGTEYIVPHEGYRQSIQVQKQKRYKIRWMKVATKIRNGQDTRCYDAGEIQSLLKSQEFKFDDDVDHYGVKPQRSSSSHDQQIPYGEEKVSEKPKKPWKSSFSTKVERTEQNKEKVRVRKLKKDD